MEKSERSEEGLRRRSFLKLSAGSGVAIATGALATSNTVSADESLPKHQSNRQNTRAFQAARIKEKAAKQHLSETLRLRAQKSNGDEDRYASENFYASFTKTLPANHFGEVEPSAFRKLRRALRTGDSSDFEAVPLDPSAARRLANPQGAFKFELSGLDSHGTRINPSHRFRGAKIAGELAEVYWQALTRDIPYADYDIDGSIAAAVSDLNGFSKPPGAAKNGAVTVNNLFRGETPGDLTGPFISQFLWQDFVFGPADVVQRYQVPLAGLDYMTDVDSWLHIQRGGAPTQPLQFDSTKRYIYNNRALGEYVHRDVSFQAYLNAALVMLSYGPSALDPGNPYRDEIMNQGGFTSLGPPFILDLVTKAANLSLTGAWYQKWRAHRFLRPEAYGGRIHFHMQGQRSYEIHPEMLNSAALTETHFRNGTYFLPQAFTEGSPTHPSYPAGHATVAGACVTVLKACFDEHFVIPNPVQATVTGDGLVPYSGGDLTLGGELNKLANNISLGRDAAGVHYRQDGIQGVRSGEQQAIALLQDHSRTFNESNFDGFNLTKFDGQRINIRRGRVRRV